MLCNTTSRICGCKSGVGACSGRRPAVCRSVKLSVAGLLQHKEGPRAGEASTSAPTAASPEQAKPRKFRSSWDAKEASAEADSKVDYLAELGRAEYNINVTHGAAPLWLLAGSLALPLEVLSLLRLAYYSPQKCALVLHGSVLLSM